MPTGSHGVPDRRRGTVVTRPRPELPQKRAHLHARQLDGLTLEQVLAPKGRWRRRAQWLIGTVLAVSVLGIVIVVGVEHSDVEPVGKSVAPADQPAPGTTKAARSDPRVANAPHPQSGPAAPAHGVGRPLDVPTNTLRAGQSAGRGTPLPKDQSAPGEPHTPPRPAQSSTLTETRGPDQRPQNDETPSRHGTTPLDSVQTMAAYLVARLGREDAEKIARGNAGWYEADRPEFAYWLRVAETIKGTAPGSRHAR